MTAGVPLPCAPAFVDVPEQVTASVGLEGFPLAHITDLFDHVFRGLFPALGQAGVQPAGPAYSLYTRTPTDTIDLEIGIPVDRVLDGVLELGEVRTDSGTFPLIVRASALPGGRVATAAHLGSYDGLGGAWQTFVGAIGSLGEEAAMPYWEVYTTEPAPDMDPADLRTDLFTALEE